MKIVVGMFVERSPQLKERPEDNNGFSFRKKRHYLSIAQHASVVKKNSKMP